MWPLTMESEDVINVSVDSMYSKLSEISRNAANAQPSGRIFDPLFIDFIYHFSTINCAKKNS